MAGHVARKFRVAGNSSTNTCLWPGTVPWALICGRASGSASGRSPGSVRRSGPPGSPEARPQAQPPLGRLGRCPTRPPGRERTYYERRWDRDGRWGEVKRRHRCRRARPGKTTGRPSVVAPGSRSAPQSPSRLISAPRSREVPDQVLLASAAGHPPHLPSPDSKKFLISSSWRGAAETTPTTSGVGGWGVGGLGPVGRFSNFFGAHGTVRLQEAR